MPTCVRIAMAIWLASAVSAGDTDPTVRVMEGPVRGSLLKPNGAVFRGIPFASPPVGDLRWRPPVPGKSWTGVRDATAYGAPCAQNVGGQMLENSQEDCLYLNVWTSAWPPRSPLPVMFWIHGGGNYQGTASTANFDGESLARHGVVVVTANYRLTVFGFLAHPGLTRESPHHASGNYGLMDQIAALEWVHHNIGRFGGDPGNVTLFGQSAGAVDANVLMTSPLTRGLFHRVIAESGTVTRNPDAATLAMTALGAVMTVKNGPVTYSDAPELTEAERDGEALLGTSLNSLRARDAPDLLKVVSAPRKSIGPANGVIVDGWVLPKSPADVFASGKQQRVPLLIGNNSRERTPPETTPEEVTQAIQAMYGPLALRAMMLYAPPEAPDPLYGGRAAQWVVGHDVPLPGGRPIDLACGGQSRLRVSVRSRSTGPRGPRCRARRRGSVRFWRVPPRAEIHRPGQRNFLPRRTLLDELCPSRQPQRRATSRVAKVRPFEAGVPRVHRSWSGRA